MLFLTCPRAQNCVRPLAENDSSSGRRVKKVPVSQARARRGEERPTTTTQRHKRPYSPHHHKPFIQRERGHQLRPPPASSSLAATEAMSIFGGSERFPDEAGALGVQMCLLLT
ncbi:hypothetical protein PybrP1_003133 [[Pythium] brassicae (nom. inval.)]|nr:hypothetical protein PybrP1_003133 [[Pythium] brassicae (nom. inval.)]